MVGKRRRVSYWVRKWIILRGGFWFFFSLLRALMNETVCFNCLILPALPPTDKENSVKKRRVRDVLLIGCQQGIFSASLVPQALIF
jgi:hypothetical protein